jgi:hydrogenase/urease accessory protein HupE
MPERDARPGRAFLPWLLPALAVWLVPRPAAAHTLFQGVGSLWSGVAHLLTSPAQLAFLVGLAIWTSFQDFRLDPRVIAATLAATFAGGAIAPVLGTAGESAPLGAALMLLIGLAAAARLRIGAAPVIGLASVGGLVGGAAGGSVGSGLPQILSALGGSLAGASVLSYGLLGARRLDAEWGRIALRAAASWIAAIGLMMLAFAWVQGTGSS